MAKVDASVNRYDGAGEQTVFAVSGGSETRAERIARWEAMGHLDPNCPGCRLFYDHPTLSPFAPSHDPNPRCRSGKHPHCTCDACF